MNYQGIFSAVAFATSMMMAGASYAAGGHSGGHNQSFGQQGKIANVTRTIDINMFENRFEPSAINVKDGETIRFVVRNKGEAVHEFNIGRPSDHAGHQKEMAEMMDKGILEFDRINHAMMKSGGMMHSDPNSVLLEPGKSANLIWKFKKTKRLEFACNVPGHYESGMIGKFSFSGAMD
ncbi:MAG: cupredoxin domain-containing protein [Rhodospirillales bacterium]|nr:cupredoxin domain-containing protein [Rhodospirillales bacterium]